MTRQNAEFVFTVAFVCIAFWLISVIYPSDEPRCITIGSVLVVAGECR